MKLDTIGIIAGWLGGVCFATEGLRERDGLMFSMGLLWIYSATAHAKIAQGGKPASEPPTEEESS